MPGVGGCSVVVVVVVIVRVGKLDGELRSVSSNILETVIDAIIKD
jgi:hypothetical protein